MPVEIQELEVVPRPEPEARPATAPAPPPSQVPGAPDVERAIALLQARDRRLVAD
jgi:hypothetical protein